MKPTNAYKYLRIPCNTVRLIYVHVSATLLAILTWVSYKTSRINANVES